MFIEERHQEILKIIEQNGSITTTQIQDKFGVSYDSAKRDLRILEEKGLLKRTHGGAIPLHEISIGRANDAKAAGVSNKNPLIKAISDHALSLIADNDVIFISGETSDLLTVNELPDSINCKLITNSIKIAEEARKKANIKVYFLGGEMNSDGSCFDGYAIDMVRRLRFDKCFFTSKGLSTSFGASINNSNAVPFWNEVISSSKRVIGLYPSETLQSDSVFSICPASRLDCIITDKEAKREILAYFEELNIHTIVCEE